MSDLYKLIGRLPVPCNDVLEWGRWYETADRRVAETQVGPLYVSTVFLGLDHGWPGGPTKLFETMVFDGGSDGYQERYETWGEAEAGHARAVEWARERLAAAEAALNTTSGSLP